jgi:hypothetical protein
VRKLMSIRRGVLIGAIAGLGLLACACKDGTTTPSADTPDDDAAEVETVTEQWEAVVPVGGATAYSFSVGVRGTVSVTLLSVGGQFVPGTIMLGVGIGTPNGTGCSVASQTTVQAGTTAQVTGTYDPGLYCANVADVGNLFAAAAVSVSIEHP